MVGFCNGVALNPVNKSAFGNFMTQLQLIDIIPCANVLGEGIQWNSQDGAFWWTDIHGVRLHKYTLATKHHEHWPVSEKIASFCFDKNNRMLAAFASEFAWYDPVTGARESIGSAESILGNRSNDGRCDRFGRFWMGSLVEDKQTEDQSASLYVLEKDLSIKLRLSGLSISNALSWSPDNRTLYHADSPTHQIRAFDFNGETGELSNPRIFATTEEGVEPDGACIDAEGYLWNAQWGGSRVRRYAADGSLALQVDLPVSQVTCCALGGDDLSILGVTTARIGLSDEQLAREPKAGHVFLFQTPIKGLAEARFGN